MLDEPPGILVLRAVVGVRIENQLRVREVLLQDPGVDRVDDHVPVAVDDQRRLRDCLQVLEGVCARRPPLGQRFELRRRNLVADLGIADLPKRR